MYISNLLYKMQLHTTECRGRCLDDEPGDPDESQSATARSRCGGDVVAGGARRWEDAERTDGRARAGPLAPEGLALQREGALGARLQGRSPCAPRRRPGSPCRDRAA